MAGKSSLVEHAAKESGLRKVDVEKVVDLAFEAITAHCKDGERVTIQGFGTFEVKTRKAKKGRNPKTGEEIQIAAKNVLTFKASKP